MAAPVACPGMLDTDPPPPPLKDSYEPAGHTEQIVVEGAEPMDCYIVEPPNVNKAADLLGDARRAVVIVYDIFGLTTPDCDVNMKHNADRLAHAGYKVRDNSSC